MLAKIAHGKGNLNSPFHWLAVLCLSGNEGHQGPLTCVASQKDGSLILTGSVDCHAKLINAATGKVSASLPLPISCPDVQSICLVHLDKLV